MSRREILGFAALVCVACCIGPIFGVLGAITALGVLSTVLGVAGFAVATAAIAAFVVVHRRRTGAGGTEPATVAVELTRPRS